MQDATSARAGDRSSASHSLLHHAAPVHLFRATRLGLCGDGAGMHLPMPAHKYIHEPRGVTARFASAAAWDNTGSVLAAGCNDGLLFTWTATPGWPVAFQGAAHEAPVTCVSVADGGQFIATAGGDLCVRIWRRQTGVAVAAVAFATLPTRVSFAPGRTAPGQLPPLVVTLALGQPVLVRFAATGSEDALSVQIEELPVPPLPAAILATITADAAAAAQGSAAADAGAGAGDATMAGGDEASSGPTAPEAADAASASAPPAAAPSSAAPASIIPECFTACSWYQASHADGETALVLFVASSRSRLLTYRIGASAHLLGQALMPFSGNIRSVQLLACPVPASRATAGAQVGTDKGAPISGPLLLVAGYDMAVRAIDSAAHALLASPRPAHECPTTAVACVLMSSISLDSPHRAVAANGDGSIILALEGIRSSSMRYHIWQRQWRRVKAAPAQAAAFSPLLALRYVRRATPIPLPSDGIDDSSMCMAFNPVSPTVAVCTRFGQMLLFGRDTPTAPSWSVYAPFLAPAELMSNVQHDEHEDEFDVMDEEAYDLMCQRSSAAASRAGAAQSLLSGMLARGGSAAAEDAAARALAAEADEDGDVDIGYTTAALHGSAAIAPPEQPAAHAPGLVPVGALRPFLIPLPRQHAGAAAASSGAVASQPAVRPLLQTSTSYLDVHPVLLADELKAAAAATAPDPRAAPVVPLPDATAVSQGLILEGLKGIVSITERPVPIYWQLPE